MKKLLLIIIAVLMCCSTLCACNPTMDEYMMMYDDMGYDVNRYFGENVVEHAMQYGLDPEADFEYVLCATRQEKIVYVYTYTNNQDAKAAFEDLDEDVDDAIIVEPGGFFYALRRGKTVIVGNDYDAVMIAS